MQKKGRKGIRRQGSSQKQNQGVLYMWSPECVTAMRKGILGTAFKHQHQYHQLRRTSHYLLKSKRLFPIIRCAVASNDDALLALSSSSAQERSTSSVLEDLSDTLTGAGRAFEVVAGADFLSDCHTLWFWVSPKGELIH